MENRSIYTISPWKKNPRNIKKEDLERLKELIKKLGVFKPFVITEDGTILGGNMRYKACMELGIKEVPVTIVKAQTEDEKLEYALADNDRAGYYVEKDLLDLVRASDINLDLYKVDLGKMTRINELLHLEEELIEDTPPEVPEEADSKVGEVYQLGRHRLMCGDATKVEDVEKLMNGNKARMIFTDPPYNVDYGNTMKEALRHKSGGMRKILNDKFKDSQAFYQFLYDSISSMRPFVSGDVYICMSSSELHTLQKAFIDCGGHWSTFIIWVKQHFTIGRANYQRQYEPILYGWFDGSSHYWSGTRKLGDVVKPEESQEDEFGHVWLMADNLSMDVWEFDRPTKSKEHPTMKPIKLCARGIINSSKENDIVMDLFGGSGSTLIACEQVNRICYMMELDPKYCDVIRTRYNNFIKSR